MSRLKHAGTNLLVVILMVLIILTLVAFEDERSSLIQTDKRDKSYGIKQKGFWE